MVFSDLSNSSYAQWSPFHYYSEEKCSYIYLKINKENKLIFKTLRYDLLPFVTVTKTKIS